MSDQYVRVFRDQLPFGLDLGSALEVKSPVVEPGQPSLFDRSSIYFIRQGVQIRDITILEVVLLVLLNYILTDNLLH